MSYRTLSQYLQLQQGNLTPELSDVIETIATTCKAIDQLLQKGALAGVLGSAQHENVQGEEQKKLDVISNDYLIDALKINKNEFILNAKETNRHVTIDLIPANRFPNLAGLMQKRSVQIYADIGSVLYALVIRYWLPRLW